MRKSTKIENGPFSFEGKIFDVPSFWTFPREGEGGNSSPVDMISKGRNGLAEFGQYIMVHCLCCAIALIVFMVQTARAVCK